LDVDQFVNALGLAGSQAAGLMASQYGAMAKRFHSGKAAQNGMLGAMLAKEFEMLHNGFKQYSSLASSHASVDALRNIRAKHGVKGADVASVYIETTPMEKQHCGWPYG